MGFKIERIFGKCPVTGCGQRKVIFGGVERDGRYVNAGLVNNAMNGLAYTNNIKTFRELGVHCEEHGRNFVFSPVKATAKPDSECTDKCRDALGPNCECSCVGKNHGKGALLAGLS